MVTSPARRAKCTRRFVGEQIKRAVQPLPHVADTLAEVAACINPATPAATATLTIAANATPTFSIFVTGSGAVANDPAANRIFVRFKDGGGVTRGSTSVAVRTQ